MNAFVLQTLAHGGVAAEDDAVKKCLRFCQFHYAGGKGSWNLKGNGKVMVYTAATLVLALDALYRGVEAKAQAPGWTYLPGHATLPTGSMTCAGLATLAIVKERLWAQAALAAELRKRLDHGLLDGVAWLSEHFGVEDNPDQQPQWQYYYLYGLERTGAKLGLTWIGTHDWYREGAAHLLAAQQKDGGWQEAAASGKPADATESAITQTCFALLFLKRSTRPPSVPLTPPVLTGGGGEPADSR